MAVNVNRVVLTGNLTHDPEFHAGVAGGAASRCRLRLAVNGRKKATDGVWTERPNFVNVTVWGGVADTCAKYLGKGRAIAVDGRLEWHEWTDDQQRKRQSLEVIGENVQFLGPRPAPPADAPGPPEQAEPRAAGDSAEPVPALAGVAPEASAPTAAEDIPF